MRNSPSSPPVVYLQNEPDVPLPAKFNGSRRSSSIDFKKSMTKLFFLQPRKFPSDEIRIVYLSTFFTDSAKLWYKSLEDSDSSVLQTLEAFWVAFQNRFGNPLASEEQKNKLLVCRQGRSEPIEEFNSRFHTLTLNVNFNDEALRSIYLQAILAETLEKLYDQDSLPSTLEEMMSLCELIESRRRQVQNRRNMLIGRPNFKVHQPLSTTADGSSQLNPSSTSSNLPSKGNSPTNNPEQRGPLSDEERQRRRSLGLFNYCGENRHFLSKCPKKSKNFPGRQ